MPNPLYLPEVIERVVLHLGQQDCANLSCVDRELSTLAWQHVRSLTLDHRTQEQCEAAVRHTRRVLACSAARGAALSAPPLRSTLSHLAFHDCLITELPDLSGLPLRSLNLTNCRDLRAIANLQCLTELASLRVVECPWLHALPELAGLPLGLLHLVRCDRLQYVPDLVGLPLTELHLASCNSLLSTPNLKGLPLKSLNVENRYTWDNLLVYTSVQVQAIM